MTTTPTATDDGVARHSAPPLNHFREATVHLELATEAQEPETVTAHATLALAHATILATNEARVANLIGFLTALEQIPGGITPAGVAKMRLLESRIDSALGTDEIPEVPSA